MQSKRAVIFLVVVMTLVAAVPLRKVVRSIRCRPPALSVIDDPAQLDDKHLRLLELDSESWVRRYRPDRSSGGYNLVLFQRRVPLIIDMNSRVVHSWPEVRATGRIRLNRDGSLAVIGSDNLIKEYGWDGELKWYFQLDDKHHWPHHDLIRLRNGNYLVLVHSGHSHTDHLLEVDRKGDVVWEWWFEKNTAKFPGWDPDSTDPSHTNSIRELPENRWYDAGDERFRPGNILVSARSLNTVFIIDKISGDIVWSRSEGLDGQHEAVMVGGGVPGEGLIMIFNNGLDDLHRYRRSEVWLMNPLTGDLVWRYGSQYFFSSAAGIAQPLPGGNSLIASSHGGRVIEVNRRGKIVWEWVPPYKPMRPERVAYDHCPQLADLPLPAETNVVPEDRRPYVDADLYKFDFGHQTEKRTIGGRVTRLLQSTDACRDLRIPVGAILRTDFGIDGERLNGNSVRARFRLTIDDHQRPPETMIDSTLDETSDPLWRRQSVSIARYTLREVTLCIETAVEGDSAEAVYWANPLIQSKAERQRKVARTQKITDQERRLRQQQLKALGYVD